MTAKKKDPQGEPPVREWILTEDMDTVRRALQGVMNLTKNNANTIKVKIGRSTSWLWLFLKGTQENLHLKSMLACIDACDYEVVVRPKSGRAISQRRLEEFRRERGLTKADKAKQAGIAADQQATGYPDIISADDPDRELKVRMLDGMEDAGRKQELVDLFRELREDEIARKAAAA